MAGIALAGAASALLMVLAELTPIATVDVAAGSCEVINDANPEVADRCELSGLERHGGALLLLGALALAMAWGAGIGRSRPAAVALAAIGAIVLLIALATDLPETTRTGAVGANFEGAAGRKGIGFWLELAGGLLAAGAGVAGGLRSNRPRPESPETPSRRSGPRGR